MNNRYIFRGKRKDNGEWVEGLFSIRDFAGREYYAIERREKRLLSRISCDSQWTMQPYEVIPETVGQCTGLKDKNGKLIFEEDIIRTKKYGRVIAHSTVSDYDIFRITYVPAVFRLENIRRAFNLVGNSADYEAIGNIHDNPELLEVER